MATKDEALAEPSCVAIVAHAPGPAIVQEGQESMDHIHGSGWLQLSAASVRIAQRIGQYGHIILIVRSVNDVRVKFVFWLLISLHMAAGCPVLLPTAGEALLFFRKSIPIDSRRARGFEEDGFANFTKRYSR